MKAVNFRNILLEKYNREDSIKGLQKSVDGCAVYIGEISPGCRTCFTGEGCNKSVFLGNQCPFKCDYCFYDFNLRDKENLDLSKKDTIEFYSKICFDDTYKPSNICFNSEGEPFLYLDDYKEIYPYIKKIEDMKNISIHKRIYTTGIYVNEDNLRKIKSIDIEEIRFHPSATQFDQKIFDNMKLAKDYGFRVSVEEPSWPLNKENLFMMLPVLNDIGVDHLNINEVDLNINNIGRVNELYPNGRMYKNLNYHLYDEGLVYDIMEEVLNKKYNFSVLSCNSDLTKKRLYSDINIIKYNEDIKFKRINK